MWVQGKVGSGWLEASAGDNHILALPPRGLGKIRSSVLGVSWGHCWSHKWIQRQRRLEFEGQVWAGGIHMGIVVQRPDEIPKGVRTYREEA